MALLPELSTPEQQAAYAYVLGQYLGDGYLAEHRRKVFNLRVTCSNDWPLVIERLHGAIQVLLPANSVGRTAKVGCTEVWLYSKRWPMLLPQHGRGPKHLRSLALADWQADIVFNVAPADFVSALLHSDGCRAANHVCAGGRDYVYPRYFFSNRSEDIHSMFQCALEHLGIRSTRSGWQQSVARAADVALLDRLGASKAAPWPGTTKAR